MVSKESPLSRILKQRGHHFRRSRWAFPKCIARKLHMAHMTIAPRETNLCSFRRQKRMESSPFRTDPRSRQQGTTKGLRCQTYSWLATKNKAPAHGNGPVSLLSFTSGMKPFWASQNVQFFTDCVQVDIAGRPVPEAGTHRPVQEGPGPALPV